MTVRWYWVRHAPLLEGRGRLAGRRDVPADLSNREALRETAALLPADALWLVSPLARARRTAETLADGMAARPEIRLTDDLMEQAFGAWEGLTWDEIEPGDFWDDPVGKAPPGGESFAQVVRRIEGLIGQEAAAQDARPRVAVCHAGPIRAASSLAWGLPLEETTGIPTPDYLSVTELTFAS